MVESTAGVELSSITAEAIRMAENAGLVYVGPDEPGYRRLRRADKFVYRDTAGKPVRGADELQRIARLAIPPAYEDVWICTHPRGHLQATGRDARGRKQYRYHPEWRATRDDAKFDRMIAFGEALPRLRRRLRRDLALNGLPREKVLAVIVTLLDMTRVRIGNESYVRDNKSYGLTTLRNRHAAFIRDGRVRFSFRGKGGTEHEVVVDDRRLARIVRRCQQLPGQLLFQYVDDNGTRRPVTSDLVNEYLQEITGAEFTAKDFRTWGATVRAFTVMASTPLPERTSERALKSCIVAAIRQVAAELRNTPAVCRKSYINPVVFEGWRCGALHRSVDAELTYAPRRAEAAALAFLRAYAKADASASKPRVPERRAARARIAQPTASPAP
jgi:DNA topoisomerase-1